MKGRARWFALALSVVVSASTSCDDAPRFQGPQIRSSGTCPESERDAQLDRWFRKAKQVVADRIGYEAQGCSQGDVVAYLGVIGLTSSEESRLRTLTPSWLRLDLFETKYSMDELDRFGREAEAALNAVNEDLFTGYAATSLGHPDLVFIYVSYKHRFN